MFFTVFAFASASNKPWPRSLNTRCTVFTTGIANGDASPITYGSAGANASTAWDADHITGCHCEDPGYIGDTQHNLTSYHGYDCSLLVCPAGDFLRTTNQTFEEQFIRCNATSGSLTLTFRSQTTAAISFDAPAATVDTNVRDGAEKVEMDSTPL